MMVLNTIMAQTLRDFKTEVDLLISRGEKKEIAILHILRNYIRESRKRRFEGDNYSKSWAAEAKRRGLSNLKTTPEALDAIVTPASKKLFLENGIFTERELDARYEIVLEEYVKKIQIEARVLGYMMTTQIIPAAIAYQNQLVENIKGLKDIGLPEESYRIQLRLAGIISGHIQVINESVDQMVEARKQANKIEDMRERASMYCNDVKSYFDTIRYHADKLEGLVDDKLWPLPKYRELLFLR